MEFLSEKAITLWGPFAFIVILLLVMLYLVVKYFLGQQKHWYDLDEHRTKAFVEVTREFNTTAKEFNTNATNINAILVEVKQLVGSMNVSLIKLNAKQE